MQLRTLLAPVAILAACGWGGGNVPSATSAGLDVRGASNTPCTITITDGRGSNTWEIGVPNPPVPDTSLGDRGPLTTCDIGDAATVSVAASASTAPACVHASRTSTQLCFIQDGCLGSPDTSNPDCPATLTLVCAGVTFYDHVPWQVCQWLG